MDEIEIVRRDRNYEVLNKLIDGMSELSVFPSLVWLWSWDIVKDNLDSYSPDSGESYITNPKLTEKDVWDMFWEDADKNGFTLEYGSEQMHEDVFDWMISRDILVEEEEVEDE